MNTNHKNDVRKIGVDSGSMYLKVVGLDANNNLVFSMDNPHKGKPLAALIQTMEKMSLNNDVEINVTGTTSAPIAAWYNFVPVDEIEATITGVNSLFSQIHNIISIGSGSLSLIRLSDTGEFLNFTTNSLCAAGTGSFLDEQSERLSIKYEMLSKMPPIENPPVIATRCAVFAKSDIIHRQQEGYSKAQMWSGLCKGTVDTVKNTLFKGRQLRGKTVILGGVVRNCEFLRWLQKSVEVEVFIPENPHFITAIGCALQEGYKLSTEKFVFHEKMEPNQTKNDAEKRPVLSLEKSSYPVFDVLSEEQTEDGTEIRIHKEIKHREISCYLGYDIGSTSTKAVIINDDDEVLADYYRRTAGDPIGAVKLICQAMAKTEKKLNARFNIKGVGTTGSGRLLAGKVMGADLIKNEITAHLTGAMRFDPAIDTIFEIGGQDSKYIHTKNGFLQDANMNYVCAAGTGSFIEEIGRKLDYSISEIGDSVMGIMPPVTTDRCTVFMEQDAAALLQKGFSRKEVIAGVLYSIVQNYLSKVVGHRYYSKKKIFFQGATARNKGLVAAFEKLLHTEIVVSPYCHVMGAYGIALLIKKEMKKFPEKNTDFQGLDFGEKEVILKKSRCEMCENYCEITEAMVENNSEVTSWGHMCGREKNEKIAGIKGFKPFIRMKKLLEKDYDNTSPVYDTTEEITVGIPNTLMIKYYLPFYRAFFKKLRLKIKLSEKTDKEMIGMGIELTGADFCFPVKLAHAHVHALVKDSEVDYVFLPFMITAGHSRKVSKRFFCPYIISHPSAIKSSFKVNNIDSSRIVSPVIDLRWDEGRAKKSFSSEEWRMFGNAKTLWQALETGKKAMDDFHDACRHQGRKLLDKIENTGEIGVVILGHPYNVYDHTANLNLPEKLASLGLTVIPLDFLPLDDTELGEDFSNLYWETGKKNILAAKFISQHKNLYALVITNFSCGPDSFVLSYLEEIMQAKPMLILEIDEHGADAGYMTRLEAFGDVIQSQKTEKSKKTYKIEIPEIQMKDLKKSTLLIPQMHPTTGRLFAAALRGCGFNARCMTVETRDDLELGKKYCRGTECIPACSTIGKFLNTVNKEKLEKPALFMPTASGPCRFGQYSTLHRIILNQLSMDDVPIFSWSSEDSYDGLGIKERKFLWNVFLIGDLLFKIRCRLKPYERNRGECESVLEEYMEKIEKTLSRGIIPEDEIKNAMNRFAAISLIQINKPLVGIVGEIYIRCNLFSNQYLVEAIEEAGGEAWLAPVSEWILYTSFVEANLYRGKFDITSLLKNRFMKNDEKKWNEIASKILYHRTEPPVENTIEKGRKYFPLEFEGESILTAGRALEFFEQGADLVINCAPFNCMHGNITAAVFQQFEGLFGLPIINIFYDGERDVNGIIRSAVKNRLKDVNYHKYKKFIMLK